MRTLIKLTPSVLAIETEHGSRKFKEKIVDDWMFSNSSTVRLVYNDFRIEQKYFNDEIQDF